MCVVPFCGIPGFALNPCLQSQKVGRRTKVHDLRSPKRTKIHEYVLLRLEDAAMRTAAVAHLKLLIPKLYIEAKTPIFTPFLHPVNPSTRSLNVNVEVSACVWDVPGQSGAELLYALT